VAGPQREPAAFRAEGVFRTTATGRILKQYRPGTWLSRKSLFIRKIVRPIAFSSLHSATDGLPARA
jgi:hypothetical protein